MLQQNKFALNCWKIWGLMSQKCPSCVKYTVCNFCHQGVLNQNKIKDASSIGWWELLSSLLNDDHCQPNSIWCGSVENDREEFFFKIIYSRFLPQTDSVSKLHCCYYSSRKDISVKRREKLRFAAFHLRWKMFWVSKIDGGIFPLSSLIS